MIKKLLIILPLLLVGILLFLGAFNPKPKIQKPLTTITPSTKTTRSYYMGFSMLLPPTSQPATTFPKKLEILTKNSDALVEHPDVPWKALLEGQSPDELAQKLLGSVVAQARAKNLKVFVLIEPLDGVNREQEAVELRQLKRSLTETEVQAAFRNFAKAVVKTVRPDYLGLAAEVNLFRMLGSETVYQALVKMVNDTAQEIKRDQPSLSLYVSANLEAAWGVTTKEKQYQGFDYVFQDFLFMDGLGITTYPLPLYDFPDEVPADYLSRPLANRKLPVIIDESGWPSKFNKKVTSSEIQAQWIRKLGLLADSVNTRLLAQLLLMDVEPAFSNQDVEVFTTQGLYTYDFQAKPALAEWQTVFKRPKR